MLLKLITASLLILPTAFGQTALTAAQIAKKVSPSVVVIQGKTDSGEVLGSGFIVSNDGKIVTNLHVIREMKTASVQLANGEMFDSLSVLAIDERRDLAVVQIPGFNLSALEVGDSDVLTVGEPLVIVGSPRGLEGTVTAGILSSVRDSGQGFKVLQTDAAVNPGNSGGPLINKKGQAIGVVSFKMRSAEGLNFAVPINYVLALINNLHGPMTLEQMRRGLDGPEPAAQQKSGPSLKGTLDWLKAAVSLSANHYVRTVPDVMGMAADERGTTKDVTWRTIPRRFESCTITFDTSEVWVWDRFPKLRDTHIERNTIPLGALTGESIVFRLSDYVKTLETPDEWVVPLEATSKVILSESWHFILGPGETEDNAKYTIKTESEKVTTISFTDESVANRVMQAFKRAADLCRGKEPF